MTTAQGQRWQFAGRFRRNAFGWRSKTRTDTSRFANAKFEHGFLVKGASHGAATDQFCLALA
jgi:hypothetical protein